MVASSGVGEHLAGWATGDADRGDPAERVADDYRLTTVEDVEDVFNVAIDSHCPTVDRSVLAVIAPVIVKDPTLAAELGRHPAEGTAGAKGTMDKDDEACA